MVEVVDGQAGVALDGVVVDGAQGLGGLGVELVLDLSHDLFDDVFEGHEARGAAVLVEDDGDVDLLAAQLPEELLHALGLGHEVGLLGHLPGLGVAIVVAEEVFDVDDADDVVAGVLEDGDA